MTETANVIAVVPTYNRKALVAECVQAILNQTAAVSKVVVIDNASTDGTREYLDERGFLGDARVDFVESAVNSGSAGGFQIGLERAAGYRCDWVWVIDNDAIPAPSALAELLDEAVRQDSNRVVTISYQRQLEGNPITYRLPRNFLEAILYGFGCPKIYASPGESEPIQVDWFPFVSALIPTTAIESAGVPKAELFYYGEDMDYSLRLRSAGFSAFLVPKSIVDHDKPRFGRSERIADWRLYYLYRNTLYVIRTQGGQLRGGLRAAALLRMTAGGLYRVMRQLFAGDRRGASLTFNGIVDGFRGRLGPTLQPASSD